MKPVTKLLDWAFEQGKRIPAVRRRIEREYENMLGPVAGSLHPYRGELPTFEALPAEGIARQTVLDMVRGLSERERERWQSGKVSGAVYEGNPEHIDFLNQVYALTSQTNPLHADVWPSICKFEAEIVAMTANLLGGLPDRQIVGAVTSGGSESILLAMKAYRDRARARGQDRVEVVAPDSAHTAFDKAAETMGIDLVRVPVGPDYRADVERMKRALSSRTVALVGSAPSFPHGVIDPIAELSDLARAHKLGLHVDACLGGFMLPFARMLGYEVPVFDFRLLGVTSMSADTHKYGYAAKGTSVVLYRGAELRRYQYFVSTDWPGGLYFSPTFAGSRAGGLSAACWAAMVSIGERGYLEAARRVLETASEIKAGIAAMPELRVLGDPLFVIAFDSPTIDIYRVLDGMSERGWSLNGLQRPPSVHLCVTLRHTQPGVAERFLADLRTVVAAVRGSPAKDEGMAPIYGLAGTFPVRGAIGELLRRYIDKLYEP